MHRAEFGRAVALALGRAGYAVAVNYACSAEAAESVVAQIRAHAGEAIAIRASVAESDQRRALIEATFEAFGDLDVLVNNAGITSPGRKDLLEATEQNWETVFATNLKGPFFLAQLAANRMIAARGRPSAATRHYQYLVHLRVRRLHESGRLLHDQGGDANDDLAVRHAIGGRRDPGL